MEAKYRACVILLVLVALTPLAYATPPDPSWIRGLYDGADFDEVVVLLTGDAGIVQPFPLRDVWPLLVPVGAVPQIEAAHAAIPAFGANPARAPPVD